MDDDGKPLPHDGVVFGELQVRGPWVIDGYFKEEESSLTHDGGFPTGDVATIDSQSYIQIPDRPKDLFKSGGEWFSSIDVENTAMGHPDIVMAAVIGVSHKKWGEGATHDRSRNTGQFPNQRINLETSQKHSRSGNCRTM
ncbi:MAG: hypothetical protein CM1200mP14_07190 [Gammaproteobacteria bacterium]|nr:MAG: hypothetical protein CM1200mP14_07190 [Gammaproteobacteria bacterium]